MVKSYYEYCVDVQNYETRETFDIVVFRDIFGNRRSLKVYERWYGSEERATRLISEVRKGGTLLLVMPKKHIRGWCLMTARGIVQEYSLGKWLLYNKKEDLYLTRFFYAALNRATEIDLPKVKFRLSVFDTAKHKLIESFFTGLGCDIEASAKYY